MLRGGELASMRRSMQAAMPSRCDILSNVGGVNDLGNQTTDWQPVNKNAAGVVVSLSCRFVPLSGNSESDVADQTTSVAESSLVLPYGAVVDASQRIRVVDGATYEVIYVEPNNAEDLSLLVDVKVIG